MVGLRTHSVVKRLLYFTLNCGDISMQWSLFSHIFWSLPPFLQRGQSQTKKRIKWCSKLYRWQLLKLWLPCLPQYYKADFFFFKSLGTAFRIRGLVVVSIKGFQQFNRALWKGCVDVVEIENVSLSLKTRHLGNGNTLSLKSLKSTLYFNDRCAVGKLQALLE